MNLKPSVARKNPIYIVMAFINIHEDTPIRVLKSVFNQFDADGNGVLDQDEFNILLSRLGIEGKNAQDACQLLADKDGDGLIDKNEFYEWIKKDQIQSIMNDSSKFRMLCAVANVFKSFDVDGDKTISWEEFKQHMVKKEKQSVQTAQDLWRKMDTKNAGEITFEQYWNYTKPPPVPRQPYQSQLKANVPPAAPPMPPPPPSQAKPPPSPQQMKRHFVSIDKAKVMKCSNKEQFLTDEDFVKVFAMTKDEFSKLKVWKQKNLKQKAGFW
eukprot:724382_1